MTDNDTNRLDALEERIETLEAQMQRQPPQSRQQWLTADVGSAKTRRGALAMIGATVLGLSATNPVSASDRSHPDTECEWQGHQDALGNDLYDLSLLQSHTISNRDYHEVVDTDTVSGTTSLDVGTDNFFDKTLSGDTTFTFDNPSTSPGGNTLLLVLQQDSTGGRSVTWPSSVEWPGGSAPSLSTSANAKHVLTFISPDGGSTWLGLDSGQDFS